MIWTPIVIVAVAKLAEKMIDAFILNPDIPEEERKKAWQRWFKMFDPLWEALKLDVKDPPV